MASPPGKKLQNVLLLSGGEKSLTALALLVAIFQFQPSPFCALDEVDAALDETNVGRLADLLHSLSKETQFLLVTHSKRMMQIGRHDLRRHHAGAGRLQGDQRAPGRSGAAAGYGVVFLLLPARGGIVAR